MLLLKDVFHNLPAEAEDKLSLISYDNDETSFKLEFDYKGDDYNNILTLYLYFNYNGGLEEYSYEMLRYVEDCTEHEHYITNEDVKFINLIISKFPMDKGE